MPNAVLPFSASTTAVQASTYLIGVCLFSISFLVFVNSSISFIITDILHQRTSVGDAVGTLGFADELTALLAGPAWGLASDRLGAGRVAALGYAVIACALVLLVRSPNLYPGLLAARVFFAVGAAAATTMVTAILPALTADRPSVLAGYVGLFTGSGALLALAVFLPLPAWLAGVGRGRALEASYYIVACVAALVAVCVLLGLRGIDAAPPTTTPPSSGDSQEDEGGETRFQLVKSSVLLASLDSSIALGYLGGFVARASTVAISLFIPLYINTFFIRNQLCASNPDLKECRDAYILSSILTGIAQLVALLCAPLFGHCAARRGRFDLPVILAAAFGIIGYSILPRLRSPEFKDVDGRGGGPAVFLVVAMIGVSQIGCIVCSLGSLGKGILAIDQRPETQPLIAADADAGGRSRVRLKGSIAGVYSLSGAAAILILTKLGGVLFDKWSNGVPFYMMAVFNGVLLVATLLVDASHIHRD